MNRTSYVVGEKDGACRLVDVVFSRMSLEAPTSRSEARRAVMAGAVRVNGQVCRSPGLALRVGARVDLFRRPPVQSAVSPARPRIVFERDGLLVVDKPAGLPTVPSADRSRESLVRLLEAQREEGSSALGVHQRLDAATSGLVLFATQAQASAGLARQSDGREIRKVYLALVRRPERPLPDEFVIDEPIGEAAGGRAGRMGTSPHGKPAVTMVRIAERLERTLLVEARPLTGRKHQIRVHLASRGMPILGDTVHAPGEIRSAAPRLMLHAARLGLAHPVTGEPLEFSSAPPEDFARILERERGTRARSPARPGDVAAKRAPRRMGRTRRSPSGLT